MFSDKQIVEGCKEGMKEAFRSLYEKYASYLLGICLRYCGNIQDSEDILQDSLVKIYKSINTFCYQSDAQFLAWLKKIVINNSINFLKEKSKIHFLIENTEIEYIRNEPIDEIDESECDNAYSNEELLNFIKELPDGYRIVFNLYVFEDKSHKEISELLGISESTSKSQLFKARKYLQNKININIKQKAI